MLLDEVSKSFFRSKYDDLVDVILEKYLPAEILENYIGEESLEGLSLWHALLRDFGLISFKQTLEMQLLLFSQLKDPSVTLSEKLHLLQHTDQEILPIPTPYRIGLLYSFTENSTVKAALLHMHERIEVLEGGSLTWASLKDQISELLNAARLPASDLSNVALTVQRRIPRPITIKSSVTCYKCGGLGHKLNVCPSKDDDDEGKSKSSSSKPPAKSAYSVTPDNKTGSNLSSSPTFGVGYKASSTNLAFSASHVESPAFVASDVNHTNTFLFDSGASVHITHQKDLLHNFIPGQYGSIAGLDPATPVPVCGTGTLNFMLPDGSWLPVRDVQYVPSCGRNLISATRATFGGADLRMVRDGVFDVRLGVQIATRTNPEKGALYRFSLPCVRAHGGTRGTALAAVPNAHSRLGHPSHPVAHQVGALFPSYAGAVKSESKNSICEACVRGKATRSLPKFSTTVGSTVKAPLELVHSDVCGPFSQTSLTDDRYFVVFVDDYTHFMAAYPIKRKSDVYECARSYFLQSERFFHNRGGYKPIAFRTDNGGEYTSSQLQNFLTAQGITHQTTVPYNILK